MGAQAGAAARYSADLQRILASGSSPVTGVRYSVLLRHASVTNADGSQHLVEWQADTLNSAELVFEMADQVDLPALPDCPRLSRHAHVPGCP
jgi:hypothetical protein